MPRDLVPREQESECDTLKAMSPLTSQPRHRRHSNPTSPIDMSKHLSSLVAAPLNDGDTEEEQNSGTFLMPRDKRSFARNVMNPFSRTLTIDDIEECVALENAAFPEDLRATRAKFDYRLRKCSNLCFALYTSYNPHTESQDKSPIAFLKASAPTLPAASPVESSDPDRKKLLLAHIISTMSTNATVQDEDMALPDKAPAPTDTNPSHEEWVTPPTDAKPRPGNKEEGRTICLHSLAVLPSFQKKGLGVTLLKAYVERLEAAGVGDRIALICLPDLVPFYEKCGFRKLGESEATFGGVKWMDMVKDLKSQGEQIEQVKRVQKGRVAGKIMRAQQRLEREESQRSSAIVDDESDEEHQEGNKK